MKRVLVYCEGPTEETFIKRLVAPLFYSSEVFISPFSCNGISRYAFIKKDLSVLCREDPYAEVTTMLDYYGLPSATPGSDREQVDFYGRVNSIEKAIEKDVQAENLHVYLSVHEFEALLFSDVDKFSYCMSEAEVNFLRKSVAGYSNPEMINRSYDSAPSKRILKVYPEYSKIIDGYNIAANIGIDRMRKMCPHFNAWLNWLAGLADKV